MTASEQKPTTYRPAVVIAAALVVGMTIAFMSAPAAAQEQQQRTIELETIEIESEVPRRVAQFFVQRDQLQYQQLDDQPTFLPELLESVDEEPF